LEVDQQESFALHLSRLVREAAMWTLLCVSLYLILALISYDPDDPGWSYTGISESVDNAAGPAGAWFADVLLFLFGWLAYLFPVMVAWSAVLVFRRPRGEDRFNLQRLGLRWVGFFVTLASGAALAALHVSSFGLPLPTGPGGILGGTLSLSLVTAFNPAGSTLFLVALFLSGFTLFTGLSWLALMDHFGRWTLAALGFVRHQMGRLQGYLAMRNGDAEERTEEAGRGEEETPQERRGAGLLERLAPMIAARREPVVIDQRVEPVIGSEPTLADEPLPVILGEPAPDPGGEEPIIGARPATGDEAGLAAPATRLKTVKVTPREQSREWRGPRFEADDQGELPPLSLLDPPKSSGGGYSTEALQEMSRQVEIKLKDFGVVAEVVAVHPGPVVTLFELQPAPGTKASKITSLAKDLARALSTISVRVVEVIPGKPVIGLEIPNQQREIVYLGEVLSSELYQRSKSVLSLALGKDISGRSMVVDLARMPHALIAGTTGSGKSVAINAMILSLLYKARASDVRLIMIDPKMLELSVYEGIPHLLTPVVTDMKEAANALRWCVGEMERRYRLMAALGVRNILGYNRKVADAEKAGSPIPDPMYVPDPYALDAAADVPVLEHLPYIVVIIDELADMMMVVGKKVEELIARLAQKARASGIHLLLATQRPSVDVITGLIKANIPTRMAFQVSSRIDSRTILDQMGAEHLLGHGDMLYMAPGASVLQRIHGAFVDDNEVHRVVQHLKATSGGPDYFAAVLQEPTEAIPGVSPNNGGADLEDADPLYDEAVRIVTETRRASISGVQRRLKIGYNRAARMVEEMERTGIVGPAESNGNREVLAPPPPED
jgi:S-DNA-T family DNA segregation ATPase FtsK/SpoIIIE